MSVPKRKVRKALRKKGFEEVVSGDHMRYWYWTMEGLKTHVSTKTSHGSGKDIPDSLISVMATQCHLTNAQFQNLVGCPLTRDEYEALLRAQDAI